MMLSRFGTAALLVSGLAAGAAMAQPVQFSDQTLAAGVTAIHTTGPGGETTQMTGGGAVGDFNRDGFQDLFVLGGRSAPDKLFINNGDGTFTDRAASWGVARTHWGYGVAVGDFDGDGWLDMFITSGGSTGSLCDHVLYRNNGNGTFTNIAIEAGVWDTTDGGMYDGFGVACGDYDLDGDLDLAVAGWNYATGSNRLFRNGGDARFEDVTTHLQTNMLRVRGFTPRFIDMDGDHYPELLWVSDFGTSKYFVNNTNGLFLDATATSGVGLEANGMGCAIGDFNGDGRPDWYVTSITTQQGGHPGVPGTGNMLYLNAGDHHFVESSVAAGVKDTGWGWGTAAADFRNIGRQDLVATNGWQGISYLGEFLADPARLFLNNGDGTFSDTAPACGVTQSGQGRGLLTFDYNNDGKQDIVIFENGGPLTLYRNDTQGGHYLRVFVSTRAARRLAPDGYGAHVTVQAGGTTQHRWIGGGSNYLSQSELSAHFGLGTSARVEQLRVEWPDGQVSAWSDIPADRTITVKACIADFNGDGSVSLQDLFDMLAGYFSGHADVNLSGATTIQDIFDFLAAWFAGCN